jgi:hypothetical protein
MDLATPPGRPHGAHPAAGPDPRRGGTSRSRAPRLACALGVLALAGGTFAAPALAATGAPTPAETGAVGPEAIATAHGEVLLFGPDVTTSVDPGARYVPAGTGRVVGVATDQASGVWVAHADGTVEALHGATWYGDMAGQPLSRPVVGIAATPSGLGYWLVADDGGIFSYGDAQFFGSTGAIRLNQPIVGMAGTPSGLGYWLVASDGGIFSYGDARFFGSTGAIRLNQPIVGMAPTRTTDGYWLVASDGGIFAFGDAVFLGSAAGTATSRVVGIATAPDGYWISSDDGGVYPFGDAEFHGSATEIAGVGETRHVAAVVARPSGGYVLAVDDATPPLTPAQAFVAALPADRVATWDRLAECESLSRWNLNTGNGYYGGLQFSLRSWTSVGGTGRPNETPREEQIMRAEMLVQLSGDFDPWPSCARQLGLPR